MRPRVFPAEDAKLYQEFNQLLPRFNEAAGIPRGRRPGHGGGPQSQRASMRPRVFPAEDRIGRRWRYRRQRASMRPRVFPAEDGVPLTIASASSELQ